MPIEYYIFIVPLPNLSPIVPSLPSANIVHGTYRYTADIQALASKVAPHSTYPWTRYHTPIDLERLRPFLNSHPDRTFAALMFDGLSNGFRVGFDHQRQQLRSRGKKPPFSVY